MQKSAASTNTAHLTLTILARMEAHAKSPAQSRLSCVPKLGRDKQGGADKKLDTGGVRKGGPHVRRRVQEEGRRAHLRGGSRPRHVEWHNAGRLKAFREGGAVHDTIDGRRARLGLTA